jgi:CheY-like chemotaxis protein
MKTANKKRPPRVLVVDDDESTRTFADQVLRRAGYEVVLASNALEALKIALDQTPFNVFVIDLHMPQMWGDELARQLRLRDPDAKVLYFTGYSERLFDRQQVLRGDEAFLDKPATMQGLAQSVSLLLFGHLRGPETVA